jgi:nucleoside-diphosphate-sugar epimerase
VTTRRVLIAGCGYLGQATADLFHNAGWEVEGWTRSARAAGELSGKPYRVEAVDISSRQQVEACKGRFDAVIHCASTRGGSADVYRQLYLDGVGHLLAHFARSTVLFVSSTSVYAQTGGEWVTEKSAAKPEHETGKILLEAEQRVIDRNGIVARLVGIYGPGRSHLLKKFMAGEAVIDPKNDRFVNQVHRDDAAAALLVLLDRPVPGGEIFNVVDDQPILQSQCYRWLATRLKREPPPVGQTNPSRKRGVSHKRVSNAKLRALAWVPRYPTFFEAMEKSVLASFS